MSKLGIKAHTPAAGYKIVPRQVTEVEPVRFEQRSNTIFADFERDAFGTLQIEFAEDPDSVEIDVRLGEKLTSEGSIDRTPPGSISYCEVRIRTQPGRKLYRVELPAKELPASAPPSVLPAGIPEIRPFRYAELECAGNALTNARVRQLFVHAPFDDEAGSFASSDDTLNAVWDLCKHSMKATTAFGLYIDGERERTPYEADAYINMLSHYACDLDPRVAQSTMAYLMDHPTWPTEWSLHMPMMAAADFMATGDPRFVAEHYNALKAKLLMDRAREDGLLRGTAIVDWPPAERDEYNAGKADPEDSRQVGPAINTVANAFYCHALGQMAFLAIALGKRDDAVDLETKARSVRNSFHRAFFDSSRSVYIDGEGSNHASLHANMFALAFGLVPAEHSAAVADFVVARGMACSVYGAQYLLEALYATGRDKDALRLMTAKGERSWWNMIKQGSTMTMEAWSAAVKPNLTWNHAWGAAPANIISRYILGVRPTEPGSTRLLVAPQPGSLKWARGKVPTAQGAVSVEIRNAEVFTMGIDLPQGTTADIALPRRKNGTALLDGKPIAAKSNRHTLLVENVTSGRHVFESR